MIFFSETETPDVEVSTDEAAQGLLACPNCRGKNLHQSSVLVFQRRNEDKHGRCTEAHPGGSVSVHEVPADAFAGRRDDLRIGFACEDCAHVGWLFIVQHQGQTFMRWRRDRS